MSMIRTTISLQEDLHKKLMFEAVNNRKSLSAIINERLTNRRAGLSDRAVDEEIKEARAFFHKIGKMIGKTDWKKVIREERDRDNA